MSKKINLFGIEVYATEYDAEYLEKIDNCFMMLKVSGEKITIEDDGYDIWIGAEFGSGWPTFQLRYETYKGKKFCKGRYGLFIDGLRSDQIDIIARKIEEMMEKC